MTTFYLLCKLGTHPNDSLPIGIFSRKGLKNYLTSIIHKDNVVFNLYKYEMNIAETKRKPDTIIVWDEDMFMGRKLST